MSILEKHLAFVNDQIAFQGKMIDKFSSNSYRKTLHEATQGKFKVLAADLADANKILDQYSSKMPDELGGSQGQRATSGKVRINLTPQDLEGLPEDILEELSISEADKTEFAILALMDESKGIVSLDKLIVGLFKKTGEKHKRATLTSRLYRMAQKEQVFSVPNKKGVYSTRLLTDEEVENLISG